MRRFEYISCIIFLLLLFLVCNNFSVSDKFAKEFKISSQLLQIDSLIQLNPDSALTSLKSSYLETLSEFEKNYYTVLLSEALYKTYNPQVNRLGNKVYHGNSLIEAICYFDSLYLRFPLRKDFCLLSARSHYMNGVGLQENDSIINACKEFFYTKEIVENNFNTNKFSDYEARFLALTYNRIAEIFHSNGMGYSSLYAFKNALYCYRKIGDYDLSNTYRFIGNSYWLENQKDSALYYYRVAIKLSKVRNNIHIYNISKSEAAHLYYEMGYVDTAFMFVREGLRTANNEDIYLATCHTLGLLFSYECQYDSAIFYLEKSINRDYFPTQAVASEHLLKCYNAIGDTSKMEYYKTLYGNHFSQYREKSEIVTELTKIYESYKDEISLKVHNENKAKQNYYIFIILILIFSLIIVFIIFKKFILKLKSKYHRYIREKDKNKRKIMSESFITEPICIYILGIVNNNIFKSKVNVDIYKEFALNKEQLIELRIAVDKCYNKITQKLIKQYPELKSDDIDYCCLYLLNLKETDISALLQRAYPTVCQRSRKLKRIFNTNLSLPEFIKCIIDTYNNM